MNDITPQWVKMNPFEASSRLNELKRENATLRADRDRLDWLEGEDGQSWTAKWYYWGEEWINRAAIDAAMKEAGDDAIMRQHLNEGGTPT